MKKQILVISTLLIVVILCSLFISCQKNNQEPTPAPEKFEGVEAYFLNEVISTQEIENSDKITKVTWTKDEIQNLEEGFISLLDKKDIEYNKYSTLSYEQVGPVSITLEQRNTHRIVAFTTKDSDKATGDAAMIIRFNGVTYTQSKEKLEDMTFDENTKVFIAIALKNN